jgi:acetyltransferase
LQIRPIKPDDADLFVELFKSLSPSSVYLRFFQHIKELSPEMIAMLTQTDYDRHMALVAIDLSTTEEKMLGAARIIADPDITQSEFSIMIGDQWQGQGIGEQLLIYLLKVAKKQGINKLWGTVLPENTHMLRLGKKLGFGVKFDRDEGAYYLDIDLTKTVLNGETKV